MCVVSETQAAKCLYDVVLFIHGPIVPHEIIASHSFFLASEPKKENQSIRELIASRTAFIQCSDDIVA